MRLSRSARLIGIVIALLVLPTGSALAQTAVKLALSGTASQTAGTAQSLTIWALDGTGAAVTSYTGPKSLTFSGATASSNPVTVPTVTDNTGAAIAFGTPTTITFTNGIATVSGAANGRMTLYKAETAVVSVTDGTILTTGSDRLSPTVSAAALNKFAVALASPQTSGTAFTGTNTVTAQDAFGNTVSGFNAATNNVTIAPTGALSGGTISGLSGGNRLTSAGNFVSGVATLTTLVYTGPIGTGTFTATAATGGFSGTSGDVTILPGSAVGTAVKLALSGVAGQTAGTAQSLTIWAMNASGAAATDYTGDKILTFSGAASSPNPVTAPTVTDKNGTPIPFGTPTTITFTNGIATVAGAANGRLTLYKAETAVVSVTDGTILTTGSDRLSPTVSAAALNKFAVALASPQASGTAFTGTNTVTAQDAFGNTVSFNAATNNVTLAGTGALSGGTISGLSGGNRLTSAGNFVSGVATLTTLVYTGPSGTGTFAATAATGGFSGTSGDVTIAAGAATRLVITGSGTQAAGVPQSLTITAKDGAGSTVTSYTGAKTLTFSGATSSPSPVTAPTVSSSTGAAVPFGTATTITFTDGIATVSGGSNGVLTLYRAETALVAVTDGTISAAGADRLSVVVGAGALNKFAVALTSPQASGVAFSGTNTITAQDAFGNTVSGFNAATTNVTLAGTGALSGGTISGLSGGNLLNSAGDFVSGVATLTTLVYTGPTGTGTFTATAGLATGASGNVTIAAGAATRLAITGSGTQTAGVPQSLTITAKDGAGSTVTSYTGAKTLTFSGATSSPSPVTAPTVSSSAGAAVPFGTVTTITFANGVATVSGGSNGVLTLNRAETALVAVTDGTISAAGADRLSVVVGAGALNKFAVALTSPQASGVAFSGTNTITAQDAFGNTVSGFNAATTNVTLAGTGALSGGTISGLSGGNTLTGEGDFVSGVATLTGLTYTGASGTGTFTATAGLATGASGNVTIAAGAAVKLALSGTASQTAGTAQSLTIWALDGTGAAATSYTGPKSLTFSGATASVNPVTAPTVTDNTGAAIAFGTPTTITFTNGIATVSGAANGRMTLYKAETAVVSVTDGTILTTGADRLSPTVSAGALNKFAVVLTSPQTSGIPFAGTNMVTAQDAYGNPVSGFNASTNPVTIAPTGALSGGTISGLSGGNLLNSAGDFVSGVATLTTLTYTGAGGTGTVAATATGASGTSGNVTVTSGPSPMAYWRLDESSGATAADASGNNHVGTLVNGATFTTGRINNGVSLDGVNDYLNLGNLGLTGGTLSLWVNPTSVSNDRRLLGQLSGSDTQAGALVFDPSAGAPGSLWVWTGSAWNRLSPNNTFTANAWSYVTVTFGSGVATLYVNGSFVGSQPSTFNFSGVAMGLGGKFLDFWGNSFSGLVDEVQIYSQALSAGEVAQLYAGSPALSRLVITGSAAQAAGATQALTITAKNNAGATITSYTGDKVLTFSGATASVNPVTAPTVTDKTGAAIALGTPTTITFTNGVATVAAGANGALTLYKAETAVVAATDGTLSATGADRLTVAVSGGALNKFGVVLASPQTSGIPFAGTNTVTAQDAFGNTVPSFNASTNNVTIAPTGALSGGTISGLSGGNKLTGAGDFVSGVATLTTLTYTGATGTGTFTATATGASGTSGSVTITTGPSPMAYWRLDESAGTSAADASGNNHVGTLVNGATFTTGRINNGVSLDGVDDYLNLGDLGLTGGTLSLWVNPTTVTGDRRLLGQLSGDPGQAGALVIDPSAGAPGSLWVWTGSAWNRLAPNNTFTANTWSYVTVTFGSGVATLYVNGTFVGSQPSTFNFSGVAMGLGGKFLNFWGNSFSGLVDEVQVYSQALTAGEVAQLYAASSTLSRLVITGSAAQAAGATQSLTITAKNSAGATITSYTGDKLLTFSGANASVNPVTAPTVTDKTGAAIAFGTPTTITFTNGVATVSGAANGALTLYKAETATVAATDGTFSATGADRLTVTVSGGTLNKFGVVLASPQTSGIPFAGTNTVTAQDSYGNPVSGFNASTNNVTIAPTGPLSGGIISGLSGGNKLTAPGDFVSGVATLTTLTYTGANGSGTFTATATGASGTSGSVTITTGPSPLAYWRLDESSGATAADASGNNHVATLVNGAVFTTGRINNGVSLDGVNDYVNLGTLGLSGGTLSLWVNPTSVSNDRRLLGQLSGADTQAGALSFDPPGTTPGSLWVYNGSTWGQLAPSNTIPANAWSYVTVTFGSGVATVYVNGAFVGSQPSNFNFSGAAMGLGGKFLDFWGNSFSGLVDEVQVYSQTLSGGQVAQLYAGSPALSRLVITGSAAQAAGATQSLTITAKNNAGATITSYTGDKALTFSGANASVNPVTAPTVTDKTGAAIAFGTPTTITFTNGVATVSGAANGALTLYKAETATVAATDGTLSATGADRLTVAVSGGALNKFGVVLASPQTSGIPFAGTNTVTAQDQYGNAVTGFNASTNTVTIVPTTPGPLSGGTVSGLSGGGNTLTGAGDFVSGVATLTTLTYTGPTGTGTFRVTATGASGTSGNVTVTTGPSPMAYWRLDESSGTTAADASGNNHVGTLVNGATFTTGRINNGVSLDGVDDYLNLGNLGLTAGTVSLWVNPTTVSNDRRLLGQLSGSDTQAGALVIDPSAGAPGSLWVWTGSAWNRLSPNNTFTANTWSYVTVTFGSGAATLYVNGSFVGSQPSTFNFSGVAMGLGGKFLNFWGNSFSGLVDEVQVYSQTLSAGEVAQLYAGSPALSRLVVTGSAAQAAGATQALTITAKNNAGATITSYTGDKLLTFSGATASVNPVTPPTVTSKTGAAIAFGTPTTITFTNGVATVGGAMTLYKAETATVAVTDGTLSATGADRLTVAVSAAALNKFAVALASPQTNGIPFAGTNTVTAQDAYGNAVTGFNASTNNVTIAPTGPLSGGIISGLSGGNKLTAPGDFVSGVATLTTLTYTGANGSGTFTATATGASGTSGTVTVTTGPVPMAYWRLDESSGTTAADASGNNHVATLVNGATFTSGRTNNGVSLDGANDYLNLGDLGLSVGTLSLWVSPTTVTGDRRLLGQLSGDPGQAGALTFDPTGTTPGSLWVYNGSTWLRLSPNNTFTASTWSYLTVTFGSGVATAYVNGSFVGSQPSNFNFSGVAMGLGGKFLDFWGNSFSGLVDEVQVYSQTLTAGDVTQLYNTVTAGSAMRLVITGTGSQAAGATQALTITAKDHLETTITSYTGDKLLTFSGATASVNPVTAPTVTDKTGAAIAFGTPTTITFTDGVATVAAGANGALTLYKAETALVAVTDGTISTVGADRLTVAVSGGALNKFGVTLASPQTTASPFVGTNTITAQDVYGNAVTGFNASTDNVTLTLGGGLSGGTISGLSGGNKLNSVSDFSNGVATLTTLIYNGPFGTGTFTATATSGPAGTSASVTVSSTGLLPRAAWTLFWADSQEINAENAAATRAFDGNPNTYWHTQYSNAQPSLPHEIQIDLGGSYSLSGFRYLPRQDGATSGRIGQYAFYVSTDSSNWGAAVATGTFPNTMAEQQVLFSTKTGRYIRLRALSEVTGLQFTSVGEISVIGSGGHPPNGVIVSPPGPVIIAPGASVTFQGTGSDPDGNVPLTYAWNFGTGGPGTSVEQNPGAVVFPTPGIYTVTFTVRDAASLQDPTPATRIVTVTENAPPDGAIATPTDNVVIAAGGSVAFSGSGTDPDNHLPLSYLWTFEGGTPSTSTVQNPGPVTFAEPGHHVVTLTVTDGNGLSDPIPAMRTVTVATQSNVIPRTGWTVRFASSQELVAVDGRATNAFDGDPDTVWATTWYTGPPPPYEIQIDLAGSHSINGFRYLPWQVLAAARVGQYEFYVSEDFNNWGSPVAVGAFAIGNRAPEEEVVFPAKSGRYVRFRVLSAGSNANGVIVAELNVLSATPGNQPPPATMISPSTNITVNAGSAISLSASSTGDPDNDPPVAFRWSVAGASGVTDLIGAEPGVVQFDNPGSYPVTLTVFDNLGAASNVTRTITVQSNPCVSPSVRITQPATRHIQTSSTLQVVANACVTAGQGVRFVVDGGTALDLYSTPYAVTINNLSQAEHVIEAFIIDGGGTPVSGVATYDIVKNVGVGEIYVALGDGITSGFGDDKPDDDTSRDGRVAGGAGGYPPVLSDLLTAATGHPVVVFNRGISGGSTADGLNALPTLFATYPNAQRFIINFGHNDYMILNSASGVGLNPGDPGYAGSSKDRLQQIINALNAAGRTAILTKAPDVPAVGDSFSGTDAFVQQMNRVLDELYLNPANAIPVPPVDFYTYFKDHLEEHNNGTITLTGVGYIHMAEMLRDVLAP